VNGWALVINALTKMAILVRACYCHQFNEERYEGRRRLEEVSSDSDSEISDSQKVNQEL